VTRPAAAIALRLLLVSSLLGLSAPMARADVAALPGAEPFPEPLRERLVAALASAGPEAPEEPPWTNRLLLAASPYLRRHAHNPVDWRPWGAEAFAAARRLDRPIFVSVGYATCHGCRVMEEESYGDPEVGELLNARFVAVKVDRNGRPDVAEVQARYARAMGVKTGWPLHVFLTPDGQPFYAATFIPRRDRPGRPGILTVLASAERAFRSEPASVARRAARLEARVREELAPATVAGDAGEPDSALLAGAVRAVLATADAERGGTRALPKYPLLPSVRLLLRYHRRSGDARALDVAVAGLEGLAAGALRDPLGGGFHRLARDRRWRRPHFEKTLADNARLALAYLEGWQVTGRSDFADVARETLDFLLRELEAPGGGLYAALDAESADAADGTVRAGAFYTWTRAQVREALPPDAAHLAIAAWGIGDEPTAPWRARTPAALAEAEDLPEARVAARLDAARAALARARASRPRPPVDAQVLLSWNALAVSALARAGFALDEPGYLDAARRTAGFLLEQRREDGDLARVWSEGRSGAPALLEDRALLVAALLDLSEVDPDPRWLREALAEQARLDREHAHPDGGYTRRPRGAEARLPDARPARDAETPAGNAVAAWNLVRLHALTGDDRHRERAAALFRALGGTLRESPVAAQALAVALDAWLESLHEVVVVHPAGVDPAPLLAPLRRVFAPNRVVLVAEEGEEMQALAEHAGLAALRRARDGRTTAYVCRDHVCAYPTTDPQVFREQLARAEPLEPREP